MELFLENDELKINGSLISSLNYLMYYKENDFNKYQNIVENIKVIPKLIYIPTEINFNEEKQKLLLYIEIMNFLILLIQK